MIGAGVLELAPKRDRRSTKFSSGQVLIVGGSRGLTGSVCLTATAAIRAGAGYATVAVPDELEAIFEIKLTEVMSRGMPSIDGGLAALAAEPILAAAKRAAAVVVGPGMGRSDDARELVGALARELDAPLLIDADGLHARGRRPRRARRSPRAAACSRRTPASSASCSASSRTRSPPTASPPPARRRRGPAPSSC